jgi:hypothetical protein
VKSKSLLTELMDELISYSECKEFLAEMKARKTMLNTACFNASLLPIVEDARKRQLATPFAIGILQCHAAQATQYSVTLIPKDRDAGSSDETTDPVFKVTRIMQQPRDQVGWDEHAIRSAELGVGLTTDGDRVTTLDDCSCQFPTSHG